MSEFGIEPGSVSVAEAEAAVPPHIRDAGSQPGPSEHSASERDSDEATRMAQAFAANQSRADWRARPDGGDDRDDEVPAGAVVEPDQPAFDAAGLMTQIQLAQGQQAISVLSDLQVQAAEQEAYQAVEIGDEAGAWQAASDLYGAVGPDDPRFQRFAVQWHQEDPELATRWAQAALYQQQQQGWQQQQQEQHALAARDAALVDTMGQLYVEQQAMLGAAYDEFRAANPTEADSLIPVMARLSAQQSQPLPRTMEQARQLVDVLAAAAYETRRAEGNEREALATVLGHRDFSRPVYHGGRQVPAARTQEALRPDTLDTSVLTRALEAATAPDPADAMAATFDRMQSRGRQGLKPGAIQRGREAQTDKYGRKRALSANHPAARGAPSTKAKGFSAAMRDAEKAAGAIADDASGYWAMRNRGQVHVGRDMLGLDARR